MYNLFFVSITWWTSLDFNNVKPIFDILPLVLNYMTKGLGDITLLKLGAVRITICNPYFNWYWDRKTADSVTQRFFKFLAFLENDAWVCSISKFSWLNCIFSTCILHAYTIKKSCKLQSCSPLGVGWVEGVGWLSTNQVSLWL